MDANTKSDSNHKMSSLSNPYSFNVVVGVAVLLLFQHAWVRGFFHDGYFYAALGKNAALYGKWAIPFLSNSYYPTYQFHPPFYSILEGVFFSIFGYGWLSARIFSGLFALSIILLLLYFIKQQHSKSWAYFTGIFLSLFPPLWKKAHSPNIDIPLTFFITSCLCMYYMAYKSLNNTIAGSKVRDGWWKLLSNMVWPWWLGAGIFFGLALLTKGPPALLLPMTIGLHLLLTGKLNHLKKWYPWFGLLMGGVIFSLWPLYLWQEGNLHLFKDYLHEQVLGTVVEGRGQKDLMLLVYPLYLLENLGPFFIISLIGLFLILKERKSNPLGVLFSSLYLVVLVSFSFVKWKYSNYIVPSFPAMAALSAYPITKIKVKFHYWFDWVIRRMLILATAVILIFPVSVNISRDPEVFKILDILRYHTSWSEFDTENWGGIHKNSVQWRLINGVYPYNNLANLLAWEGFGYVDSFKLAAVEQEIKKYQNNSLRHTSDQKNVSVIPRQVVLISEADLHLLEKKYSQDLGKVFKKIIFFPKYKMMVLFSVSIIQNEFFMDR